MTDDARRLDGVKGAKADARMAIRNLASFVETMEYALEHDQPIELLTAAYAAGGHLAHLVAASSELRALSYIVSGMYPDPRGEP